MMPQSTSAGTGLTVWIIAAQAVSNASTPSFASFRPVSTMPKGESAMSTWMACEVSHTTAKSARLSGTVTQGDAREASTTFASGAMAMPEPASAFATCSGWMR